MAQNSESMDREQIGPFLLLGIPKTAALEVIEAHWAQRVKWARQNKISLPLEDVNWAREMLKDGKRRPEADVSSLNADTTNHTLEHLEEKYSSTGGGEFTCQAIDQEWDLSEYSPSLDLTNVDEIKATITLPDIPKEFPAVEMIVRKHLEKAIDPWDLLLPE